jgi:ABC-type enterobactin transport system permease subunit
MGAVRLLVLAGIAPSVMFFGWVADHRSPHVAMAIACIGAAVVAVGALFTPAIRNESR